jgi:hypothetical protein
MVLMILLVVQHSLDDYAAWRVNFDASYSIMQRHGVTEVTVHRGVDDENSVLVIVRIPTREQAYALIDDNERLARFEQAPFRAFSSQVQLYEE